MRVPALALLTRSLRLEARWVWTYLLRMGLVLATLFALVSAHQLVGRVGAPGLGFFVSIAWINLVGLTLAGLSYFASAVSEEKEEMMLGLLRMTRLSPVALLLGKSTSRLLTALALVVVQLPFTLLAVTLGGIGAEQIGAVYLALLAYAFFLANLALFCSVVSDRTAHAAVGTGLLLGLLAAGPHLVASVEPGVAVPDWSVTERVQEVLSSTYAGGLVGDQFFWDLGLGAGFFLLAWACFDLCTRQQKVAAPARGLLAGRQSAFRRFGCGRAWTGRALVWKDFHFVGGGKLGIVIQSVLLVVPVLLFAIFDWRSFVGSWQVGFGILAWTGMIVFSIGGVLVASRIFQQEVQWKTLPQIWSLPCTPRQILWQKVQAGLLLLAPALVAIALGATPFLPDIAGEWEVLVGVGVGICQMCFLFALVAYMSLAVKRGAIILSLLIYWMGWSTVSSLAMMLLMMAFGPLGGFIMGVVFGPVALLLAYLLGMQTVRRLGRLAAE